MLWRKQPVRECESGGVFTSGHRRQDGERTGLNFGAVFAPVALLVNIRFRRRVVLEQDGRVAHLRQLRVQLVELRPDVADLQLVAMFLWVKIAATPDEDVEQCGLLKLAA